MIWLRFCGVFMLVSVLLLLSQEPSSSTVPSLAGNPLLTEIGRYETRGEANPEMAEGAIEHVGYKFQRPIGRHQIQEATARFLGFTGRRNDLYQDSVNRFWAQRYLDLIEHRLEHRCGRRGVTLRAIAYGYPHGHNALLCNPPIGRYHDTVALAVVAYRLRADKQWRFNQQIVLVRL